MFVPKILLEHLLEELAAARHDRREMMSTIRDMKVAGGSIPLARQGIALPPKQVDPIQAAIDSHKYANNPAVVNAMRAYADRELARHGDTPEQRAIIEKTIRTWHLVTTADLANEDDDTIAIVNDDGRTA